ncbi:hypothetical protein K438DRAFT_2020633, partial [Mycena galopus ATCC 62051]
PHPASGGRRALSPQNISCLWNEGFPVLCNYLDSGRGAHIFRTSRSVRFLPSTRFRRSFRAAAGKLWVCSAVDALQLTRCILPPRPGASCPRCPCLPSVDGSISLPRTSADRISLFGNAPKHLPGYRRFAVRRGRAIHTCAVEDSRTCGGLHSSRLTCGGI